MSKIKVAVVFGGRSNEHEISIITANEIITAFDQTKYEIIPVYIDLKGRWFTGKELVDKNFYKGLPDCLSKVTQVSLLPLPGTKGLTVINKKNVLGFFAAAEETIEVDVFFPAFHGQFGEDGCIQGLFEMADFAYTGCDVTASAIAMNKFHCKAVLSSQGIPVLPSIVVTKEAAQRNFSKARDSVIDAKELGTFPYFVKPVNLGSSIGIGKAGNQAELDAALAKVFQYDTEAIVEPFVSSRMEVNVSIRDTSEGAVASVTEIPVASGDALSYEDKYLRGGSKKAKGPQAANAQGMASLSRVIDPQDLQVEYKSGVIKHALKAYDLLGCSGVVRFDFMIDTSSGNFYFNELNPLPGSLAHYLWQACSPKVLYPKLLDDMVIAALKTKELKQSLVKDMGFKALFK